MHSEYSSMLPLTISLAGLMGLFVGSFLNVVIYRTPLGLSVSVPAVLLPHLRPATAVVGERARGLLARSAGAVPDVS